MSQIPTILHVEGLSKSVLSGENTLLILRDIHLTIKQGESAAILGASGSGKSTLLTLLAALDKPTQGKIYYHATELSTLSDEAQTTWRGEKIGFIFQSFQLLPTLTALENVMLPLEIQYMPYARAKEIAINWLEKVGLAERLTHYPSQLSGGEQQRVAIARAFVKQPELILADEMTGNLDEHTAEKVTDILFDLNKKEGTTLILVTHDSVLSARCDKRFLLHNGVLQPCLT